MSASISRFGHWQVTSYGFTSIEEINQLLADPNLVTRYPHFEIVNIQNLEEKQLWPMADENGDINDTKEVHWIMNLRWWKTLPKPEGVDISDQAG